MRRPNPSETSLPARRRAPAVACLLLFPLAFVLFAALPGCLPHVDERAREFSEDGVSLFQRGEHGHACECFEAALALQPRDVNLLYNIGQCQDRLGKTAKAEEAYTQCLLASANHAPCRHALALLLLRSGRRADAEKMIQAWLAAEPKRPDAYAEEGWRLRQDGDIDAAKARLQQALALDPQNVRANVELGVLYEHLELPERALALYERALARDPKQDELVDRINALKVKGVRKPRPDS